MTEAAKVPDRCQGCQVWKQNQALKVELAKLRKKCRVFACIAKQNFGE